MFANTGCTSAHCTFWHNHIELFHFMRHEEKHFLPHMVCLNETHLPRLKIVTVWGLPGQCTINRGHLRDKESIGNSYRSLLVFVSVLHMLFWTILYGEFIYKWPRVTKSQNSPFCPTSAFKWNSHNLHLLITHNILIWLERARWAKLLFGIVST